MDSNIADHFEMYREKMLMRRIFNKLGWYLLNSKDCITQTNIEVTNDNG